ncbi:16782_t:CDS:2 [Funneliformis geosporum]|uniref:Dihydropteridine reductase n=1 Tax=Funneliformis geosporum TaxID=1117311 RepID=A0A9W4SDQ4_9GLOM|nr:16782_t:CDS:2 [Funneliformis geosporum]CAI2165906.1 14516_t:CDS:2 [Funneliformis geosporum]
MAFRVVVYGGSGNLGRSLITLFRKNNWEVTSVGTRQNIEATHNIIVSNDDSLEVQGKEVMQNVSSILNGEKYDAILCVAGGFSMGNLAKGDFLESVDLMVKKILNTALIASKMSTVNLKDGGLLMLTGVAGLQPTPVAKAAVHHLFDSIVSKGSGLPKNAKSIAILPGTIDTSDNRKGMPNADFSQWIPLDLLSQ